MQKENAEDDPFANIGDFEEEWLYLCTILFVQMVKQHAQSP